MNCQIGANEQTGFQTSPEGATMEQNRRIVKKNEPANSEKLESRRPENGSGSLSLKLTTRLDQLPVSALTGIVVVSC